MDLNEHPAQHFNTINTYTTKKQEATTEESSNQHFKTRPQQRHQSARIVYWREFLLARLFTFAFNLSPLHPQPTPQPSAPTDVKLHLDHSRKREEVMKRRPLLTVQNSGGPHWVSMSVQESVLSYWIFTKLQTCANHRCISWKVSAVKLIFGSIPF